MIEVGEYVRTKRGLIGKVNKIELKGSGTRFAGEFITDTIIQFNDGKVYERRVKDKDIVKHSFNIVDLIERGDYVNNCYVLCEAENVFPEQCNGVYHKAIIINTDPKVSENFGWKLIDFEITEILTHEQYQANCYTVERKKEC